VRAVAALAIDSFVQQTQHSEQQGNIFDIFYWKNYHSYTKPMLWPASAVTDVPYCFNCKQKCNYLVTVLLFFNFGDVGN
jgi:hypothetical protein